MRIYVEPLSGWVPFQELRYRGPNGSVPVQLNDAKKASVYIASGTQWQDFPQTFLEETNCRTSQKDRLAQWSWPNGAKRYGSMVIYRSTCLKIPHMIPQS